MMQHIVSFSGGKDSTAMLLMMIEKKVKIDRIICIDTTKEFPGMYDHIEKVQKLLPNNLQIETFKIDFDYWFSKHVKTKGKNKGQAGYGFPDFRNRWCTALKRDLVKRLIPINSIQYHGIALDEPDRHEKNKGKSIVRMPLVEWGITEAEALRYCYDRGLDWGGLYEKYNRVSCWCCPLSRIGELRELYKDRHQWSELEKMGRLSRRQFRPDYSVKELGWKFRKEVLNANK